MAVGTGTGCEGDRSALSPGRRPEGRGTTTSLRFTMCKLHLNYKKTPRRKPKTKQAQGRDYFNPHKELMS